MQTLAAPIGGRKKGYNNAFEFSRARTVVGVVEGMGERAGDDVVAVTGELIVRQSFGAGDEFACHLAARPALASSMLHWDHAARKPVCQKLAENPTMVAHVSIVVGGPLPCA